MVHNFLDFGAPAVSEYNTVVVKHRSQLCYNITDVMSDEFVLVP